MKISLGIDFNPIRTIVSYYDEQNKRTKTLYNQPSLGILPKGVGLSFFGNQALELESVAYNQIFYPTFMGEKPEILGAYLRYVTSRALDALKGMDIQVEYVIITDSRSAATIKKYVFPKLCKDFKELSSSKCIISSRKELLDLALISELNSIGKLEEEKILVLDLNNFEYQASLFSYSKGSKTPKRSFYIGSSYKNPDCFFTGSYALCLSMLKHSADHQVSEVRAKLLSDEIDFEIFQLLLKMEARFVDESGIFYERPNDDVIFPLKINKSEYSVKISKDDYEEALEEVLYAKMNSLRRFLMNVKDETRDASAKILYYGPMAFYTDVKAVIYSVFRHEDIIDPSLVYEEKPIHILDLTHPSMGAALQSSLRFTGQVPKVSFKNFRDNLVTIMQASDSLLLSETASGTSFYALPLELQMPLSINMDASDSSNAMYVYVEGKEFNLASYLYEKNTLKSNTIYVRKVSDFVANVRIGVVEESHGSKVLFELYNPDNKYDYEFLVEVE